MILRASITFIGLIFCIQTAPAQEKPSPSPAPASSPASTEIPKPVLPWEEPDKMEPKDWKIEEILLEVKEKTLETKPLLKLAKADILAGSGFIAFKSKREVFIQKGTEAPQPLAKAVKTLPAGYDYFGGATVFRGSFLVGVSTFSEDQEKQNEATPGGGYRPGPSHLGLLVIDPKAKNAELITELRVRTVAPEVRKLFKQINEDLKTVTPAPSVYLTQGNQILVGDDINGLIKIDLKKKQAEVLEYDLIDSTYNALFQDEPNLWASKGVDGPAILRKTTNGKTQHFDLGLSLSPEPNAILKKSGELLVTSLAGLTRIDEKNKKYTHFLWSKDSKKLVAYNPQVRRGNIFISTDDGILEIDLKKKIATRYKLKEKSNDIWDFEFVGDRLLVSNDQEVLEIQNAAEFEK